MKKKLLFLAFIALLSLQGFCQAVAYPATDIKQCGNEVFDLTTRTPAILGDQDPDHFTVTYFLTEANAEEGIMAIENPEFYVSVPVKVIYARVTSSIDESYATTSFTISWNSSVYIPHMESFTACSGSYELPVLDFGNYYNEPGGMGDIIPAGTIIDETQTIYIYYSTDICTAETSFTVSINPFEIGIPTDFVVCDNNDDLVYIDLTQKIPEITQNTTNINVTFFETSEDAEFNINQIVNANSYSVVSLPLVLFVRVTNVETGCFKVISLSIIGGGCTDNTISGFASLDLDGNGCDVFEAAAAGIAISYIHDNTVYTTYTNSDGYYSFENVPDGVNTVSASPVGAYASTPNAYNFTMPANETDANFCISSIELINDVAISIVPTTVARPGFSVTYVLIYQNLGTTIQSGTISLQFDDTKLTFVNTSSAMVLAGNNTLSLTYTNLYPFQMNAIVVEFMVMEPPTVNSQDVLTFTATIDPLIGDNYPENNTAILNEIVVNSYDPNDIAVREGEYITEEQAEGYLNYVIRFQNTGDADAVNIKIETTLDDNLDWSTFQPIAASHNYKTNRLGNEVEFLFDNIHLADSLSNEPESHGHIAYRIKPKSGIKTGDVMAAQAHIYFDFNPAIDTNIVKTTVQNVAGTQENIMEGLTVYPNPASGKINLYIQNSNAIDFDLIVTDILGKTILQSKFVSNDISLDVSSLTSGVYMLTLNDGYKRISKKLIIK